MHGMYSLGPKEREAARYSCCAPWGGLLLGVGNRWTKLHRGGAGMGFQVGSLQDQRESRG